MSEKHKFMTKTGIKRVVVAVALIAIVLTVSIFTSVKLDNQMHDVCWNTLRDSAVTTDDAIYNLLQNYNGAMDNLVRGTLLQYDLHSNEVAVAVQNMKLGALGSPVRIYLNDGYAVTEQGVVQNISEFVKYEDIVYDRPYISTVHPNIYNNDEMVLEQYIPVKDKDDVIAMLCAVLDVKKLGELIKCNSYNGRCYLMLVDRRDGSIFIDTDKFEVGNIYNDRQTKPGYDYVEFRNDILTSKDVRCAIVNSEYEKAKYLYGIPSKMEYWTTIVAVDEEVAFEGLYMMETAIWIIIAAEIICFAIYFIWVLKDLQKQYNEQERVREEELRNSFEQDSALYQRAILNSAYSYFRVNLTKNTVIPPVMERENGSLVDYTEKMEDLYPLYSDMMDRSADKYVDPEYNQSYKHELSREYLIEQYQKGNMMPEYICRIFSTKIGWHFRKYVSYLSKDEKSGDIHSMLVAYDISEEMRHKYEEKELQNIIEAVSADYECLMHIDYEEEAVEFYRLTGVFEKLHSVWNTGMTNKERLEKFGKEFVADIDMKAFFEKNSEEIILKETKNGLVYQVNFRLSIDGEECWYQVKYIHHSDHKNHKCVIAAYRSIDNEVRAQSKHQKELEAALQKARDASEAKTKFLFNMSHDIRTPMNAVMGFADLAEKNLGNEKKISDYLTKLKSSGKQLLNIINDILELSRIESGQIKICPAPYDMRVASKGLNDVFETFFREKQLDFEFEVNARDYYVYADYSRINRIIFNVLSNAVKYTPPGGKIRYCIDQLEDSEDGRAVFRWTISDNGIGMSAEYLDKIFDRFSREKSVTESGIEGTGLGMSMVKEFVDMMDGTINIQSEKNKGTRVIFTLPFKRCSEDVIRKLSLPEVNEQISLKGKRILVVEDLELNREIAVEMLQDEGIIADSAENGQIAYEKVKNSKPGTYDLIFMDVQMPVMDGYESTRAIRAIPDSRLSRIPIVAMTANAFEEDRQEAIAAGMDEHLAKPVTPEKIREIIRRYVR